MPASLSLKYRDELLRPHCTFGSFSTDVIGCDEFGEEVRIERSAIEACTTVQRLAEDIVNGGLGTFDNRDIFQPNRPILVLLEGPSGCGKTHLLNALINTLLGQDQRFADNISYTIQEAATLREHEDIINGRMTTPFAATNIICLDDILHEQQDNLSQDDLLNVMTTLRYTAGLNKIVIATTNAPLSQYFDSAADEMSMLGVTPKHTEFCCISLRSTDMRPYRYLRLYEELQENADALFTSIINNPVASKRWGGDLFFICGDEASHYIDEQCRAPLPAATLLCTWPQAKHALKEQNDITFFPDKETIIVQDIFADISQQEWRGVFSGEFPTPQTLNITQAFKTLTHFILQAQIHNKVLVLTTPLPHQALVGHLAALENRNNNTYTRLESRLSTSLSCTKGRCTDLRQFYPAQP